MDKQKILIIGGSGFVSGTLARMALIREWEVWTLTRGQRPLLEGVKGLIADRKDRDAFLDVVAGAQTHWDLVVDCIGFEPADVHQDIAVFRERVGHLVFISTDFVYHPQRRRFPISETNSEYVEAGYGGNKRLCETVLRDGDCGGMAWTILRPSHIYGPGSGLGCLPAHSRDPELLARLQHGEPLALVGGGYFIQHPILASDLCETILSVIGNRAVDRQIYGVSGPDIVESRVFYQMIGEILGVPVSFETLPADNYLAAHPEQASFLCHRFFDLRKLQASGLHVPATPLALGLRQHVDWMQGQQ